ncbi:ADP-ribosylation factor-like [Penaeus monodon]|uniref:ADP-ribosylation factor-like n=1 Tax=Penaeus monodon TaxID=6687 RepID=UPI0018A6F7C6|nr:ADP-ribosylation factor-like [Penaeus monodon]
MGALWTRILSPILSSRSCRIPMPLPHFPVGLDAAGRTAILCKLKLGHVMCTIPATSAFRPGFSGETVECEGVRLTLWDMGGQARLRPPWRLFCRSFSAVVYAVDSSAGERLQEAREELEAVVSAEEAFGMPFPFRGGASLRVVANQRDLPGALYVQQVREGLDLRRHGRPWHVQPTCAVTSEGVHEALAWLAREVAK